MNLEEAEMMVSKEQQLKQLNDENNEIENENDNIEGNILNEALSDPSQGDNEEQELE